MRISTGVARFLAATVTIVVGAISLDYHLVSVCGESQSSLSTSIYSLNVNVLTFELTSYSFKAKRR